MAGSHYTIDINFNGDGENKGYQSSFSSPVEAEAVSKTVTSNGGSGSTSFGAFVKGVKAFAPVAMGINIVKSTMQWQVSLVGRYEGSQQAQARANVISGTVSKIAGVGMAFAMGGVAGGFTALASVAISTVMGYSREAEQAQYERKWENIGITLAQERGGPSLNRSRREG